MFLIVDTFAVYIGILLLTLNHILLVIKAKVQVILKAVLNCKSEASGWILCVSFVPCCTSVYINITQDMMTIADNSAAASESFAQAVVFPTLLAIPYIQLGVSKSPNLT